MPALITAIRADSISRKPCGHPCVRPEGCRIHWKTKSHFPCAVCGKPTGSSSGRCQSHIGSYYQNWYENRLRQRIRAIYD
ncbi:hypothetical protein GLOIN_2v1786344 [Rhizophagus irregularis DAOM 181602=DAOM 197198]|uniref:Uncharacterized protein n=1 Tax=Rhizophagus irregularis (strain DAOM 197198w) TaxID=1432141 RepID=A0A015K518_RHIIW|nr:hypothetical protein RirG_233780 [Rhizophagus irregularis DAOM 197198w]GBC45319.1 hypothetical protein GLOIN_2v1786344 [Rhizophagus irregularis DAOM 181602=DAOM 197198]